MIADVGPILDTIVELGLISVLNGTLTRIIHPQFNVYDSDLPVFENRWNQTIQYLEDYAYYHKNFSGSYFLCIYDGWREMTDPANELERVHNSWFSYTADEQREYFIGKGTIGEPRFYSHLNSSQYVDLPLPVIAYNRHINDKNVLLIPDHEFLATEFRKQVKNVIGGDIPWEQKLPQILWRGAEHVNEGYTYAAVGYEEILAAAGFTSGKVHPRQVAVYISACLGCLEPDVSGYVNASYHNATSIKEMLNYKYQLDLDGEVSAWSGFYWKLYSNSVVFKPWSHWEQWYYKDLQPYVHYVPLANLSPLEVEKAFEWCERKDPELCQKIAGESSKFVRKLTYEYAVKDYTIQ